MRELCQLRALLWGFGLSKIFRSADFSEAWKLKMRSRSLEAQLPLPSFPNPATANRHRLSRNDEAPSRSVTPMPRYAQHLPDPTWLGSACDCHFVSPWLMSCQQIFRHGPNDGLEDPCGTTWHAPSRSLRNFLLAKALEDLWLAALERHYPAYAVCMKNSSCHAFFEASTQFVEKSRSTEIYESMTLAFVCKKLHGKGGKRT